MMSDAKRTIVVKYKNNEGSVFENVDFSSIEYDNDFKLFRFIIDDTLYLLNMDEVVLIRIFPKKGETDGDEE